MKIYHFLDHFLPIYSGYTFRTRYILQQQQKLGLEIKALISPKHTEGLSEEEVIQDIQCRRMHISADSLSKIPYVREYRSLHCVQQKLMQLIQKERCDILHSHSPILCGIPAMKAAKKLKIPVIYEMRGLWEEAAISSGSTRKKTLRYMLSKYSETQLLKKVDKVFTICEGLKREIISRGIPEEKVYIVKNGVDIAAFTPQSKALPLLEKHHLQGKQILGFLGSLYKYEGLPLLIEAMPGILAECPQAFLLVAGEGEDMPTAKDLVAKLNLHNHVLLLGNVPHQEVLSYYSIMDILTYPRFKSRLTDIVTPLKPLEAMAMEKAVLGSSALGIQELVADQKRGLIFQAGDPKDLADKCITMLKDEGLRRTLGSAAREYVKEHRSWETIVKDEVRVYEEMLGGKR